MKKAKAKGKENKAATKKGAKKSSPKVKEQVDLDVVRKDISNIVGAEATLLVRAVMDEAMKGQLAPVKYLLEAAGVFPASAESGEGKMEDDSLAKTLLRRMGLPEDPVAPVEEEQPVLRKKAEAADSENDPSAGVSSASAGSGEESGAVAVKDGNDAVELEP